MQSRTITNTKLVNFYIKNVSFFFSPSPSPPKPPCACKTNRPAKCRNAGEMYRARRGVSFTLAPGTQVLTEQTVQPLGNLFRKRSRHHFFVYFVGCARMFFWYMISDVYYQIAEVFFSCGLCSYVLLIYDFWFLIADSRSVFLRLSRGEMCISEVRPIVWIRIYRIFGFYRIFCPS